MDCLVLLHPETLCLYEAHAFYVCEKQMVQAIHSALHLCFSSMIFPS
jgi:hypothetical protein